MVLGDGKSHKVSWLLRDTQSDDNRTSQVTSDLILNDKADILIVGGSPTTAVPAAVRRRPSVLRCWPRTARGRPGSSAGTK